MQEGMERARRAIVTGYDKGLVRDEQQQNMVGQVVGRLGTSPFRCLGQLLKWLTVSHSEQVSEQRGGGHQNHHR